jgi:O-antigen/teichoic acid export membrane protein
LIGGGGVDTFDQFLSEIWPMLRSSFIYSFSTLINALVRFTTLSIGARVLILGDYGALDTIFFAYLVFSGLIIMGLDSAILRFAFDDKENCSKAGKTLTTALVIGSANTIIFAIILICLLRIFGHHFFRLETNVLLISLIIFCVGYTISAFVSTNMRAHFESLHFFISNLISASIRIAFIIPFLWIENINLSTFILTISWASLISSFIYIYLGRKYISWKEFDKNLMVKMLSYGIPLGIVFVMSSLYPLLERFIVLEIGNYEWLSVYAASAFPALLLGITIQIVNMAWVPLAIKSTLNGSVSFIKYSSVWLHGLFIVLYLTTLAFAESIVRVFVPIKVNEPAVLFPFIGMIMLVRFSSSFTSFGLIMEKRTDLKLLISVVAFLAMGLSSWIFGRQFGVKAVPVIVFIVSYLFWIIEALVARSIAPNILIPFKLMIISIGLTGCIAWVCS